jgi:hypothetical protein
MRVPLANLRISDNEGDGEAVMEADDNGPLAGVSIDLDGHGLLFALATRKVIDELALAPGDGVFALSCRWRSMKAQSRWWTPTLWKLHPPIDLASGGCVLQQRT